ncbi:MAG: N-acetylmuramoyl-L-alanine amidase [Candidatus Ornithomonoglobus sp.]
MILSIHNLIFYIHCYFTALKHIPNAPHGAPDGGAVGPGGTQEKDVNLDIVLKLQEILENRGVRVVLTRSDDEGIYDSDADTIRKKKISDMRNRLNIINGSGADLFISIHMNAFTQQSSHGLHVFYARNHPEAEPIASAVTQSISALTGAQAHEVKTASETLYLMKNPKPPAILVECGFITNPEEEKLLGTDEYRAKIAYAIADAVTPAS